MTNSKLLTLAEVNKYAEYARRAATPGDAKVIRALCSTVRQLLSKNEEQSRVLRMAQRYETTTRAQIEHLTRERNEALDQCAELHRQIAALRDDVERLARTEQPK